MGPKYLNETKYVTRNINKMLKQVIIKHKHYDIEINLYTPKGNLNIFKLMITITRRCKNYQCTVY